MSNFYSVYLLVPKSPEQKTICYIGSTPNPLRRLKQHNGELVGGAKKTCKNRPWIMVMFVYNFPTKHLALSFELSWQLFQSTNSCITSSGNYKRRNFRSRLECLKLLLEKERWKRIPLKVHLIEPDLLAKLQLPRHINRTIGSIEQVFTGIVPSTDEESIDLRSKSGCDICSNAINTGTTMSQCINCKSQFHLQCLASWFLTLEKKSVEYLLPLNGECPQCSIKMTWLEAVRATLVKEIPDALSTSDDSTGDDDSIEEEQEEDTIDSRELPYSPTRSRLASTLGRMNIVPVVIDLTLD